MLELLFTGLMILGIATLLAISNDLIITGFESKQTRVMVIGGFVLLIGGFIGHMWLGTFKFF